jgi:hypothetical protein
MIFVKLEIFRRLLKPFELNPILRGTYRMKFYGFRATYQFSHSFHIYIYVYKVKTRFRHPSLNVCLYILNF